MKKYGQFKEKVLSWERKNLLWKGYFDKTTGGEKSLSSAMSHRGYDAYRISPRTTSKFGLKYRAVYGATVEPLRDTVPQYRSEKAPFTPKVKWYKQGFIKAGKTKGTKRLFGASYQTFKKQSLKSALMLR